MTNLEIWALCRWDSLSPSVREVAPLPIVEKMAALERERTSVEERSPFGPLARAARATAASLRELARSGQQLSQGFEKMARSDWFLEMALAQATGWHWCRVAVRYHGRRAVRWLLS